MRRLTRSLFLVSATAVAVAPSHAAAQIRRGMAVDSNAVIKIWNPSGSLRIIAWSRDSLHVEGTGPTWAPFFFGGGRQGAKFGIEEEKTKGELPRVMLVVHVPFGSRVSAKTVDADIEVAGATGYYTTVSGDIRVVGALRELQVESLRGKTDINASAPWVRVMGGEGDATIRGTIEDLAASTVAGRLTADVMGTSRARLETMTGNLYSHVAVQPNGSLELDSHAGTVELVIDPGARLDVDATSVAGKIDNQFDKRQPQPGRGGKGASFSFATDPAGARVVVRTYKGTIIVKRVPNEG